jgi:hypothetical protein
MAELIGKSPTYMLQNLRLAERDLLSDPSMILASRDRISRSASLQICFYLSLAIKSFRRQPTILLFGAGHSGSRLIEYLLRYKLGHCLRLFARDDSATKYWNVRNIRSSSSLAELLSGSKADIVIICSGISSFASISQSLFPYISKATFIISSCFGLSRKRIYNSLKTSSIFRTFQEPQLARMKSGGLSNGLITGNSDDESTLDQVEQNSFSERHCMESVDLLVRRCPDVRNMVFLLENYYSLRGMNRAAARRLSTESLLGTRNDCVSGGDDRESRYALLRLHPRNVPLTRKLDCDFAVGEVLVDEKVPRQCDTDTDTNTNTNTNTASPQRVSVNSVDYLPLLSSVESGTVQCRSLLSHTRTRSKDPHGTLAAQTLLQDNVSVYFQSHLSKFILAADIPHTRDLDNITDINGQQQQIADPRASGDSSSSAGSKADIKPPYPTPTNGPQEAVNDYASQESSPIVSSLRTSHFPTNVFSSNATGRQSLASLSATAPPKSRYDVNRRDLDAIRLETKARILEDLDDAPKMREPLGVPMHSDQDILRIFSEDSEFHGHGAVTADERIHENEDGLRGARRREHISGSKVDGLRNANCEDVNASLLALLADIDAVHDFR